MRLPTDYTLEPLPTSTEESTAPVGVENGSPLWLLPAGRSAATEAWGPLHLAPPDAVVVSVGRHNSLAIGAVAWIERDQVVVALEGPVAESGRGVRVHLWTKDNSFACRPMVFEHRGDRAVAVATIGLWDGLPVAGLSLFPVLALGEKHEASAAGHAVAATHGFRVHATCANSGFLNEQTRPAHDPYKIANTGATPNDREFAGLTNDFEAVKMGSDNEWRNQADGFGE